MSEATPDSKYFDGTIKGVDITAPRFSDAGENAFELNFTVANNEDGTEVEVPLEVSARYGMGTMSNQTYSEITIKQLESLGYKHGMDFSQINTLVGTSCRISGKMNKKGTQYNYYFSRKREALDPSDIAKRTAAIMAQMNACKPAAAQTDPTSPFGN